ncbi:GxxExxY protein [Candidatus Falkowbacteria bacterium CG10_big_fil_rev_8_21_14_0_10_44_15]|uniref:GxxExxY protein n=1 Tax=Candidatus Falkowbacteria bacterium CG10_big_fil_rev_8_21_14_0_10_44_15 TaxID=1974569 RepID=A0A2H0V0E0_9BACT|nr:MAG: GxxExxY protein [Candidatus Falkowbacteria bacterium CG10_big_fil_rev_8_21_14_0_10_44_15]
MYNKNSLQRGDIVYPELSYLIVGCLYETYNELGGGYQEKHYQKALAKNFINHNINFISQAPYLIKFKGEIIGKYYTDFIIENRVVLEIKKGNYFVRSNIKQVLNYLQATDKKLGILANFTNNGIKYIRILNVEKR